MRAADLSQSVTSLAAKAPLTPLPVTTAAAAAATAAACAAFAAARAAPSSSAPSAPLREALLLSDREAMAAAAAYTQQWIRPRTHEEGPPFTHLGCRRCCRCCSLLGVELRSFGSGECGALVKISVA
eukprot:scaffold7381_cov310-Pinguiococcus_pyrenoidosus.AAC.23